MDEAGYVVDASVALKWYLRDEEHVAEADRICSGYLAGQVDVIAPYYIRYEVASGLDMARVQGRLAADAVPRELANFLVLGVAQDPDGDELIMQSVRRAEAYGITSYDALYLALAEQLGLAFVTADRRLYQRIREHVPYARWIGNVRLAL